MEGKQLFSLDTKLSDTSRRFLLIGVWSLAIAGIFSLVLVVARTPGFCDWPLFQRLFREALVVHVDLSVLVWFLSIACVFWSLVSDSSKSVIPYTRRAAQICFILGMVFISISPIDPNGDAMMSNYIPVIMSPLFFIGLSLILCGLCLMLIQLFSSLGNIEKESSIFSPAIRFGLVSSGFIAVFSVAAFIWSFKLLPPQIDGQQYYEMGFWAGGHVLQFLHTQILMVCWLWLAVKLKPEFSISPKLLCTLFSIGLIAAIVTPYAFLFYDITSGDFRQFFTNKMIIGGGIAPTILALFIIPVIWKYRNTIKGQQRALWSALLMSVVLFLYGGFLGGLIQGQNVVIPAHYHGSIVGVTLAFMGLTYLLLPHFGYRDVSSWKLAYLQPLIYGIGQIMHISGLAYSGGYGAIQRKTPCGGGVELATNIKVAMGFMGMGGLLAIIGGFMFVLVVILSSKKRSEL